MAYKHDYSKYRTKDKVCKERDCQRSQAYFRANKINHEQIVYYYKLVDK